MFDQKVKMHALLKLIHYVKFECKEYESSEFAGSPIIGEVLKEVKEQYNPNSNFMVELDSPFGRTIKESIIQRINSADQWVEMSDNSRHEHIKNLASPYLLNEKDIDFLIKQKE